MLKLTPNPTFKAQIALTVPGQPDPAQIEIEFKHQTRADLQRWLARDVALEDALNEVIVSWDGVTDGNGRPLSYSADTLAMLLSNYPASGGELLNSYLRELTESRRKN
ncbi:MAG: phage tail assembly chaperone [Pseudomonadota bacterium]